MKLIIAIKLKVICNNIYRIKIVGFKVEFLFSDQTALPRQGEQIRGTTLQVKGRGGVSYSVESNHSVSFEPQTSNAAFNFNDQKFGDATTYGLTLPKDHLDGIAPLKISDDSKKFFDFEIIPSFGLSEKENFLEKIIPA